MRHGKKRCVFAEISLGHEEGPRECVQEMFADKRSDFASFLVAVSDLFHRAIVYC